MYFLSISQIYLLPDKSIPDDGSSNNTNFESPIKAIAIESLLLLPPERSFASVCLFKSSPTSWMTFSISAFLLPEFRPLKSVKISKCSSGVRRSNKISCYGQTPIYFLT